MSTPVNIADALEPLTFLKGRTPTSNTEGVFATLAEYRDGGVYAGGFSGASAWERHPADEVVQVLDGEATISLALPDGVQTHALSAGSLIIVPPGVWHKFEAPDGVTLMTITPGPTDHWEGEGEPV